MSMDQFLESIQFTQNKTDHLKSLVTIKEIEFIIKNLQKKKSLDPDCFIRELYQIFKEELTQSLTENTRIGSTFQFHLQS